MIPGVNPDLLQLKLNVLDFVYERHADDIELDLLAYARSIVEWFCETAPVEVRVKFVEPDPAAEYREVIRESCTDIAREAFAKALDDLVEDIGGPEPADPEPVAEVVYASKDEALDAAIEATEPPAPAEVPPPAQEIPMGDRLVDALFKIGREGVTTTGLAHAVSAKDRDAISPHVSTLFAERRLAKHYAPGSQQPRLYHPSFKPSPCVETPPPTQPEMILDYLNTEAGEKGATFVMIADALKIKESSANAQLSTMVKNASVESDNGVGKARRYWTPGMRPAASRAETNRFYREPAPVPAPTISQAAPISLNQIVECPSCKRSYRKEFAAQEKCNICRDKYKTGEPA